MNAIVKTSTFVLVILAVLPFLTVLAVAATGCDKFKKGGDADAAASAAPTATPVDTSAPTDTATPSAIPTHTWHPNMHVDGGARLGDAGVVKLADGGTSTAPIPTPIPNGTLPPPPGFPSTFPTTFPTTLPPGLPSGLPKGFPSALPTAQPTH